MRSVVVVFPASMCAMMPMFLVLSSGTCLGINFLSPFDPGRLPFAASLTTDTFAGVMLPETVKIVFREAFRRLPAVMRECPVGFRHAVCVFLFLNGGTAVVVSIQDFASQPLSHALFAPLAGGTDQPANAQAGSAVLVYFDGDLIVCTAHAPGLHLHERLDVLYGFLEQPQRILFAFSAEAFQCIIENLLRGRFFTVPHHAVDELLHERRCVNGVRENVAMFNQSLSWHSNPLLVRLQSDRLGLGPLSAVFGSSLLPVCYAGGVQRAPDDVITDTRQVLHAAASDQYD